MIIGVSSEAELWGALVIPTLSVAAMQFLIVETSMNVLNFVLDI